MLTRRTLAAVPLLLTVLFTGCSGAPDSSDSSTGTTASTDGTGRTGGNEGAFPATVEHKFGSTTVPEPPTRVVSVGLTEQDTLLELGVVPVAVTEWYGDQPSATWPWAQELLGDAEPTVLETGDGLPFEQIAALRPDLIVGTNAGLTERDYELLSAIAPTIAPVEGSTRYFSSWQDQTMQIARGLGREADGQALVDEVEGRYAEVAAAHPEWAGLTATFAQGGPYDGELYVYPAGLSTDFLTDLGFDYTTGLEEYAPEDGAQAQISAENVGLIDADVLVFATEDQQMFDDLQGFGTISSLAAVAGHRAVYTDATLAGALYFDTPLSHQYVLDRLVPALEAATRGEAPREFPA